MKLDPIKPSLFTNQPNKTSILLLISFLVFVNLTLLAQNQKTSFHFNNIPLSEALISVSKRMGSTIAFDAEKLGAVRVSKTIEGSNISEILTSLLDNSGYNFQLKYGTYLIVPFKSPKIVSKPIPSNNIMGVVIDYETHEQLPYANILAVAENKNQASTINGTFSLKNISNPVRLKISHLGYNPIDTLIFISDTISGKIIKLTPKLQLLKNVDVEAGKLEILRCIGDAGHFSINPASFANLPNMGETDVFRTLQLLPGIGFNESSSELNIRGGSADQNLVLLDGFTLYNLDHFFGAFSSINPNFVKDIQVYKGGYDARYGERVSGIIDITGKSGNNRKPTVYGGFNLISGNITTEIPITKKLTLIAGIRRTYGNVYETFLTKNIYKSHFAKPAGQTKNTIEIEPIFKFNDFNSKLSYTISDMEKISLSVYGGKDFVDNSNSASQMIGTQGPGNPKGGINITTIDNNEWKNYGVSGSWTKQWNSNYFSNFQVGTSGYSNEYYNKTSISTDANKPRYNKYLPDTVNDFQTNELNDLTDFAASFRNTYLVNSNHKIDFGFQTRYNSFTFTKKSDLQFVYNNLHQSAWLSSVFFQEQFTPTPNITVKPGLRLNHYAKTFRIYAEPRLSASIKVGSLVVLKFTTGRYFQYLSKVSNDEQYGYNRDIWLLADRKVHPVISSNHFIVGGSITIKNFFFDAEAYYKSVNGLQIYQSVSAYQRNGDFNRYFPPNIINNPLNPSTFVSGNGKVSGVDLLLKYEQKFFTSWASYSFTNSVQNFRNINNNADIPSDFDQPHKLNFVNMVSFNKFNFSLIYTFATGQAYVMSETKDAQFKTTRVYGRLPNYNRVDISANYNFSIKNLSIKIGSSIINLLNSQNYRDIYTRSFDFDNTKFGETTLIKAQSITPNFFVEFRF